MCATVRPHTLSWHLFVPSIIPAEILAVADIITAVAPQAVVDIHAHGYFLPESECLGRIMEVERGIQVHELVAEDVSSHVGAAIYLGLIIRIAKV